MKYKNNIPKPTVDMVVSLLDKWKNTKEITVPESALNNLFNVIYTNNDCLEEVLVKCVALNHFYNTNIFNIYRVAQHIVSLKIDCNLVDGDPLLVEKIAAVRINGKEKRFYSFASKYCSMHKPESYPIYDSYVAKVLKHFRDVDGFSKFTEADLKNYTRFNEVIIEFKNYYHLNQFSLKI